jgi:hypothetical protein
MNIKKTKRSFIPRDKPKSWVLGILALLAGLFVAVPIVLAGHYLHLGFIKGLGTFLFAFCAITFFCMWVIGLVKALTGRYRRIEERDWKDQTW